MERNGRVRPLTGDDIPQLVELYRNVFGLPAGTSVQELGTVLDQTLCRNPWRDDALPSLVYQGGNGRIVGCLGVMPRPMSVNGHRLQVAVSHTFMVERGSRTMLAGVELLRRFLGGPQDLSLAQGGHVSARILTGIGGSTSALYAIRWTRPLRPARYVLSSLRRRGLSPFTARALAPVAVGCDALASHLLPRFFRPEVPHLSGDLLDCDTFLGHLPDVSHGRALRPEYRRDAVAWLWELLERPTSAGQFHRVVVRRSSGDVVGWYLYYLNRGGTSEVVQIAARPSSMAEVLNHLFQHAWQRGAVAVSGQLDIQAFQALSEHGCLFRHDGGPGLLVHSRRPDVVEAIHRGDAFLTRLEGEWWIAFLLSQPRAGAPGHVAPAPMSR